VQYAPRVVLILRDLPNFFDAQTECLVVVFIAELKFPLKLLGAASSRALVENSLFGFEDHSRFKLWLFFALFIDPNVPQLNPFKITPIMVNQISRCKPWKNFDAKCCGAFR
jgi:hypothetical protein